MSIESAKEGFVQFGFRRDIPVTSVSYLRIVAKLKRDCV